LEKGVDINCVVVGLGKLGLPLAALLASRGHNVTGFDKNLLLIKDLRNRKFFTPEPGLIEILNELNLKFTDNVNSIEEDSDIFFVIVPTPSLSNGAFSNDFLLSALKDLGRVLRKKAEKNSLKRSVVNIVSTVMPGSCETILISCLEKSSGIKMGEVITLTYSPEFIALGSVIKNMEYPDMHLIGEVDSWGGDIVLDCLRSISRNNPPVARMNLKEAELVKIAVNNFVTMKISFANMLLQLADKLGNMEIDKITGAIGLDTRIGHKYLRGSMPFGGPCFPRDTRALGFLCKSNTIDSSLSNTTESFNQEHLIFCLEKIVETAKNLGKKIGICGVSYKNGSQVIEESPALELLRLLSDLNYELTYWDEEETIIPISLSRNAMRKETLEAFMDGIYLIIVTRKIQNWSLVRNKFASNSVAYLDLWGNEYDNDTIQEELQIGDIDE
jgi:UDPglucose 6-dehydrogenase